MARIISKVDPTTGKRVELARVDDKTFAGRNQSLAGALGVRTKDIRKMSSAEIGNQLAPDYSSFTIPLNRMNGISTPAVVPNRPMQTADIGLDSKIQGTLDTAEEQRQAQLQQQKQKEEMSFENYLKAKIESPTLEEISVGEYAKDGGVDALAPEISRINNELIAERENLRLQEKELMKNSQGMETSGLNAELNRLRTESYDRQAALAVTQLSLQGQYDAAKDIADRAAQAKYSAQQRYLDALDMAYERNKDLFTTAEKREFETAQEQRRQQFELQAYEYKARLDQQIKESDPLYNAQLAKAHQDLVPVDTATDKQLSTVNDIGNILSNPVFNSTFGIQNIAFRNIPSSAQNALKANVNTLINQLALAARGELKGQGQVSDFEGKLLKSAQTSLNFNMSPTQARYELAQVQGAIRTSSGLTAQVKLTDPKTGESQVVESNQGNITQAIKDGLHVEYYVPEQAVDNGSNLPATMLKNSLGPLGQFIP